MQTQTKQKNCAELISARYVDRAKTIRRRVEAMTVFIFHEILVGEYFGV